MSHGVAIRIRLYLYKVVFDSFTTPDSLADHTVNTQNPHKPSLRLDF